MLFLYRAITVFSLMLMSGCAVTQTKQALTYDAVINNCLPIARQSAMFGNKPFVAFMYNDCHGYDKLGLVIWPLADNHINNIKLANTTLYYFLLTHAEETGRKFNSTLLGKGRSVVYPPPGLEELGPQKIWVLFFELKEIE